MLKTSLGLKHIENIAELKKEMELVTGAGFDTVDLDLSMAGQLEMLHSPDCLQRAKEARRVLDGFGMKVYQGHAPYGLHKMNDPDYDSLRRQEVLLSIPAAAALGIEYLIIHPYTCSYLLDPLYMQRDVLMEKNVQLFREFTALAEQEGVKLCIENMFGRNADITECYRTVYSTARDLNELMDAVPGLTCCLDSGHAFVTKEDPAAMARELGDRLTTLHLHNNDHRFDMHLTPFQNYKVDWQPLCSALKEIGYSGSVNLEVGNFAAHCPEEMKEPSYRYMYATAATLARMIERA